MTPAEIAINSLAQGLIPMFDGEAWFMSHVTEDRREILRKLGLCISQAHPLPNEVDVAINKSGIKATMTPCVVLSKWRLHPEVGAYEITSLPELEHLKGFKVMLSLFSVADERRRNAQCRDGCTHDWHNLPPRSNNSLQARRP
jgi:hypothetical protein